MMPVHTSREFESELEDELGETTQGAAKRGRAFLGLAPAVLQAAG
jgi:hypothetical protein